MDIEKRTFSLASEHMAFIDAQVASGSYESASEVVREGLKALKERDGKIEQRLKEEVAPVYDMMQAEPDRALPASEVFASIRKHHEESCEGSA